MSRSTRTAQPDRAHRALRRSGGIVKDVCLGTAGLLGLLTVGWLVYAHISGATIVSFRTGSMSPELPTGAAAVALPVHAEEIEVGDVVTVRRDSAALPITHRVVSVTEVPGQSDARQLVLKGDDNAEPDMEPYVTTEAYRVVWGSPWLGGVLRALQTPLALGLVILAFGALVTWAFWPRELDADEDDAGVDPAIKEKESV